MREGPVLHTGVFATLSRLEVLEAEGTVVDALVLRFAPLVANGRRTEPSGKVLHAIARLIMHFSRATAAILARTRERR